MFLQGTTELLIFSLLRFYLNIKSERFTFFLTEMHVMEVLVRAGAECRVTIVTDSVNRTDRIKTKQNKT